MREYKSYTIEQNTYGNNEYSVQYNGDDVIFNTEAEAIAFIDSIQEAPETMTDKNGRELTTGQIVKIENAYFKNDNGYYFIDATPGDPTWSGRDYSLKKIGKRGKISTAAHSIAFWPLWACTNNRDNNAEAREHNDKYATIEIVSDIDNAEVVQHFREKASNEAEAAQEYAWRFGEDSEVTQKTRSRSAFLESIAARIEKKDDLILDKPELIASVVYDFGASDEEAEPEQMTLDVFITITEPVEAPETPETPEAEEVPADDVNAPETTPDAPTAAYYDVNESTAERAWNCVHMSDYKKNSATNEYRASVDAAAQIAAEQKNRVSPFYHDRIDYLLDKYSKKLAAWYNDYNRNEASCPSWFISGPANYPVRKHERKMNRERTLWEEYDAIKGIIDKIKSVGTGPIDLSDPHAREMLEDRLQSLQAELNRDKELNAYYRKHKTFVGFPDLSPEKAEKMTSDFEETKQRCPWITKIAPDYELTSLRDKIKRTQERIAELDKREAAIEAGEDNSEDFTGGQIVRNIELDRLQIIFDEKPDEEMRDKLKGNGFKWSPKNNAWQRQLTPNAERALKYLELT